MSWKPKNPFPLEAISLGNFVTVTNTGRGEAGPQRRLEPGTRVPGDLLCLRACLTSGSRESCTSLPGWLFPSASSVQAAERRAVGWGLGSTECLGGLGPRDLERWRTVLQHLDRRSSVPLRVNQRLHWGRLGSSESTDIHITIPNSSGIIAVKEQRK